MLKITDQNILLMRTDAIVNAANEALQQGGGVCGAIFQAAGADQLQEACNSIGHCDTGKAVITPAFHLKAKYIIHTVGPVYQDGNHQEAEQLQSCYQQSLLLAKEQKLKSICFPLISSGIYGYPEDEALAIAVKTIKTFLKKSRIDVYLIIYQNPTLYDKAQKLLKK